MSKSIPYWRISGFYLFYFASLGVMVPYWGLYLQYLNFDARAIGELMAIIMATKIIAPYIWGWIADHTGKGILIIRLAAIISLLCFLGVFVRSDFWWLAIVMVLFSFFWNAELPQFEANTMNHLGEDTHKYSIIRLWGSMGFVLSVVGLGILLESHELSLVPQVIVLLFAGIVISSFMVPEKNDHKHVSQQGHIFHVLKQPVVIALLLVCFLAQLSHGPYYTFYSIYLTQHDYDSTTLGWLWALGVIAEIIVFLYMHRLMPRFGAKNLLMVALLCTALRWYLIGHFVDNFIVILGSQLLHAASFGLYHAVSIELFHRLFQGKHQGRGQALYSSVSFGAGGALGSYVSGQYWDQLNAVNIFNAAALIALLAFLIAWRFIKLTGNQDGNES
ncbi:MAG: MFS transporter [Gammaproteobacteria bacterium]|nr:MFS transporter [Gammaproteobacteria bacterium]